MKPLTEPTRYSCTERTQGDPAWAAAATGLVQPIRTPPPATATFITRRDRAPARVRYIGLQTTGSHDPWQSPAKPCALEPPICVLGAGDPCCRYGSQMEHSVRTGPRVLGRGCGQPSGMGLGRCRRAAFVRLGLTRVVLGQRVEGTVEVVDAVVQFALEPFGQAVPVLGSWDVAFGQFGQGGPDLGDGQAHPLAGADHGDAAQHIPVVAPLVAGGAVAADQSLPFVEPQR